MAKTSGPEARADSATHAEDSRPLRQVRIQVNGLDVSFSFRSTGDDQRDLRIANSFIRSHAVVPATLVEVEEQATLDVPPPNVTLGPLPDVSDLESYEAAMPGLSAVVFAKTDRSPAEEPTHAPRSRYRSRWSALLDAVGSGGASILTGPRG